MKSDSGNTVERFSDRVANYVKFRPGYPPEMMAFFRDGLGLTRSAAIADIGSGTGLSAKPFLENGNVVYGVEPNAGMRSAAEKFLAGFHNFGSRDGTAENTGLDDEAVELVVAAQAFHWFDHPKARKEFARILKPGGYVVLIWNERQLNTTPFLAEYEQFLLKFANDYTNVRHDNVGNGSLNAFFQKEFQKRIFPNRQVFDLDGLLGRVLSSSYMPNESDPRFPALKNELHSLVAKHAEMGNIELLYDTTIYYSQI